MIGAALGGMYDFILTVIACVVLTVIVAFAGMAYIISDRVPKDQLVATGLAEYYLDEHASKQFRLLTPEQIKTKYESTPRVR